MVRLARSDQVLIGHWLPLPQLLVLVARGLHPDPLWARLAFAAMGALAAAALARAMAAVYGRWAGLAAGALLALHPLWAYYSLVPYQEGPMATFLFLGAEALALSRERRASLWLGLAALCRYEAWIALALAAAARWRRPLRALALFAWAPLLWVALHAGLTPAGSYLLDLDPSAPRLQRLAFVALKLREYSGLGLLALAAAGLVVALRRRDRRWAWGVLFVALVLAATAVGGHESPAGSGQVNERMAHLPAAALCASAGLALATALERARGRARVPALAAAGALLALFAWRWTAQLRGQVRAASGEPGVRLALGVAAYAHRELPRGGHIAVAGPPVDPAALAAYVRKVELASGDVARARAIAAQWSSHSPDLDRVAAHLPRPPGTAVAAGGAPADLIAIYGDAPRPPPCPRALHHIQAGPRAATLCAAQGTKGAE